jgi:opacity protein-like surface antigen
MKKHTFFLLPVLFLVNTAIAANGYPWYIGASLGYGDTDWAELVSNEAGVNSAVPTAASDSGFAYSFLTGYNFSPNFAIQLTYDRFPSAVMKFESDSNAYNLLSMRSSTYSLDLIAKLMVPISTTRFKVYTGIGPEIMHRKDYDLQPLSQDNLNPFENIFSGETEWNLGAVFVGGFEYDIGQRWFADLGFKFFTGNGKASSLPVQAYVPFVYTVMFTLAYRLPGASHG